jgi:hypothetical protein
MRTISIYFKEFDFVFIFYRVELVFFFLCLVEFSRVLIISSGAEFKIRVLEKMS